MSRRFWFRELESILRWRYVVHVFHIDEKTELPVKSVASKLFEGNKKAVVKFLDGPVCPPS